MSELIARIDRGIKEDIRVSLTEFKGKQYIDIRSYFQVEDGKDRVPTRKGITISVSMYPELKKAIAELEKVLIKKKLIDKEDLTSQR
ncbi:MAG TPA: transcriptional regulator [Syntrophaceae bacterium]|nr:transcriptional regulator [Syntrophaceae bacterium]